MTDDGTRLSVRCLGGCGVAFSKTGPARDRARLAWNLLGGEREMRAAETFLFAAEPSPSEAEG